MKVLLVGILGLMGSWRAEANSTLPDPYCPNLICNNVVLSATVIPKTDITFDSENQTYIALLPVGADFGSESTAKSCETPKPHRVGYLDLVFSHGICKNDSKRPLRDAIVFEDRETAAALMRSSKGKREVTHPEAKVDFTPIGCVDSMGYSIRNSEPSRPQVCFSLIAIERENTELQERSLFVSDWLSLNSIPFEEFESLGQFLMNGNLSNDDVSKDLICMEQSSIYVSYCSSLVYPGHYYRICCCYSVFTSCYVHTNPLILMEKYRCLKGKYNSALELKIDQTSATSGDTQEDVNNYCLIKYTLSTGQPKLVYTYAQGSADRIPEEIESFPQSHTDNGEPEMCKGTDTLTDMLKNGRSKCFYYADLWNLKFYNMGSSTMTRTARPDYNATGSDNVKLMEFKISANCMEPDLRIRGFVFHECGYPDQQDCLSAEDLLDKHAPGCFSSSMKASSVAELENFMALNTTFRCYAKAVFAKNSHQLETLSAGPADEMELFEAKKCLEATATENCQTFTEPEDALKIWVCCYFPTDPRPILRAAVQSAALPKTPADIRPYLDYNNTVCFILWGTDEETESKCFSEADKRSEADQQRFQFCANHMNQRQCSQSTENIDTQVTAFCCCGNTLNGCKMDPTKWGHKLRLY